MTNGNGKSVKLGVDQIELIKFFTGVTGTITLDCCILPDEEQPDGTLTDRIVFMVKRKDLSKSVGKNGINVKKLKEKLSKKVEIIAYSDELHKFIQYLLYPAKILNIEKQIRNDGKNYYLIDVRPADIGIAIGKNGRNIRKANIFIKRHFGVDGLIINKTD
ncbi:MAG: NusA-like transcription termination signal-binding factor [Promethearchaeota archaeon]